MVGLKHMFPFIFLLLTPSAVRCNTAFINFVENCWVTLEAARQQNITTYLSPSVQRDHQIEDLYNRFGNLGAKIDQNYNDLMERLDGLISECNVLQDFKKLSDNYREMKRVSEQLIKWQSRANNGYVVMRDLLPPIYNIQSSWSQTRALITSELFFTRLSSYWRDHYGQPWQGPCYTFMSYSQVRYTMFLEYMNFARNYFIAGYLYYSIRMDLGDDTLWLKQEFILSLQEDLDKDFEYFQRTMKNASREYWSCDQDKTSANTIYDRLTTLDTNAHYHGGYCDQNFAASRYSAINGVTTIVEDKYHNYNCVCHENKYYVSTFPVTASQGFFVVGVQLKFHNCTLYVDILEGKFQADGTIANETFGPQFVEEPEWLDHRIPLDQDTEFDLGPTMVPENQNRLITGVQLVQTDNRIHLMIHSKVINITTGSFISRSARITKKTSFGTEELKFEHVDNPDKAYQENLPYSNDNNYIKFNETSLWWDYGQTIIPFVDTQLVSSDPLTPLSGISLHIRGQEKSGGFLAIKSYAYDRTPYLQKGIRLADGIPRVDNLRKSLH